MVLVLFSENLEIPLGLSTFIEKPITISETAILTIMSTLTYFQFISILQCSS